MSRATVAALRFIVTVEERRQQQQQQQATEPITIHSHPTTPSPTMPARDRYDPARDIFTSDPAPQHPPPPPAPVHPTTPEEKSATPLSASAAAAPAPAPAPLRSSPPPSTHQSPPPPLLLLHRSSSSSSRIPSIPLLPFARAPALITQPPPTLPRPCANAEPRARLLARAKRRRPSDDSSRQPPQQRRRRESVRDRESRYRYRSPPPPIIPRAPKEEDPTPPPSRQSSPPRKRKRPGAASRLTDVEKDLLRQTVAQSDEAEKARLAGVTATPERVEEVVRSHYNDKKELGKEWRQQSKIKGLRSFNNWVKSTLIQKFSPSDDFDPRRPSRNPNDHLVVLDMGCGKGGDLLKWKSAPQEVGFYLGVDSADVSIAHARDRYDSMRRDQRRGGRHGGGNRPVFEAEFLAMDCWTKAIDSIPIARRIGYDPNVGPGGRSRFAQGGGFDIVSMMFCMHYAFETEAKCRNMLKNVAGSLKTGGRFIGTIPQHGVQEWGNSIYRVKFSKPPPRAGTFRPMWGWEYNFFLEEAVEEVPEYVVPWEAFRGIAEDYGLELEYKKLFHDVWREEKNHPELKQLSERMGVIRRDNGEFALGDEEWEACGIYLAFAFRKG
ncbi:mRNA capping enzyme-domain-containing protein [Trichophaea hybrida]|nr:mRNA capping enzyme-domain-containing protein [Trichophaea hybrida]